MSCGNICKGVSIKSASSSTARAPFARIASSSWRKPRAVVQSAKMDAATVDQTLNPMLLSVKPSKTIAFTDMATAMKEQGIDVISLSVGEPDFDTPASIVKAGMEALQQGKTRYTPNAGSTPLRKAICKKLKDDNGLEYAPDEILVCNGAKQAIWQGLLATCAPGDEIIIPAPYWVSYTEMAAMAGCKPVVIDTAEDGFVLTPEKLKAALTPKSRLIILCSPSNPTGVVYTQQQIEAVAEVVKTHPRLLVMADEIYEYLIYKPAKHFSIGTVPGMFGRTLTVNGFSKGYAMTGWRLGYLAAPRHFTKAAALIQSQSTSCACSVSQAAGVEALKLGPDSPEVTKMVDAYEERKNMICAKLRAIPGVKLTEPQGAFYVLPDMGSFFGPGAEAKGFGPIPDSDTFCMYLMKVANVAVVPGEGFGAPSCIRISYAMDLATLEKAMDRIVRSLDASVFTRRK